MAVESYKNCSQRRKAVIIYINIYFFVYTFNWEFKGGICWRINI